MNKRQWAIFIRSAPVSMGFAWFRRATSIKQDFEKLCAKLNEEDGQAA